jgi:hypothetical protein
MSRHPVSRFGAGTNGFLAFENAKSRDSSDEPFLRRSIPACTREDVNQGYRQGVRGIVGAKQALLVAYSPEPPRRFAQSRSRNVQLRQLAVLNDVDSNTVLTTVISEHS